MASFLSVLQTLLLIVWFLPWVLILLSRIWVSCIFSFGVAHTDAGLTLTQQKYSLDLLRHAGMLKCKTTSTPMSSTDKLTALDGDLLPSTAVLWDYSICLSPGLISLLRSTECVSIFMPHKFLIGHQLSVYYAMFASLPLTVCTFSMPLLPCFLPSRMRTGLVVQMIGNPRGSMQYSLLLT